MVQAESEQAAIICVTERSVQLSVAERATHGKVMKRKGSNVISTDVDGVIVHFSYVHFSDQDMCHFSKIMIHGILYSSDS
jgi:hypothetical protein